MFVAGIAAEGQHVVVFQGFVAQDDLRQGAVVGDAVLEVAQPYDAVLVLVDGAQVVAGDGMRFQRVVHEVGERFVQRVVDEQSAVAGEYPDVAVAQVEDALYAVVLYVLVVVQADFLPLLCGTVTVQQQAALDGVYPKASAPVYIYIGLLAVEKGLVGSGNVDFPGFGSLLVDAVQAAVGVHYVDELRTDGYIDDLLGLQ